MKREDLLAKYEEFGEDWQVKLLNREFQKIDNAESKEKALEQINWWGEHYENQTGNLSLSQSESDKCSDKSQMFAELSYLDEFKNLVQQNEIFEDDLTKEQEYELDKIIFEEKCKNDKCSICGIVPVDSANGFDTCNDCLNK